jgi:hypothetical protein
MLKVCKLQTFTITNICQPILVAFGRIVTNRLSCIVGHDQMTSAFFENVAEMWHGDTVTRFDECSPMCNAITCFGQLFEN